MVIIFSLIGGIYFVFGLAFSNSAPQQAAAAATGAAFAIVPYCAARAISAAHEIIESNKKRVAEK